MGQVGAAAVWVLNELVAAIRAGITQLVNSSLSFFYNLRNEFAQSLIDAVDPTGPQAVWGALSGSLFLFGLTVAAVLQIAIGIMNGVTLGAGFLVTILIGLILSFGLTALLLGMPQANYPSAGMVDACQTFANGYQSQTSQANNWTSWANAFTFWETGTSDSYAFTQLKTAYETGSDLGFVSQALSFVFSLMATGLSFFAKYIQGSDPGLAEANTDGSLILAVLSVILEVPALLKPSPTRTLDITIGLLDASTVGIDIAEWQAGY